MPVRQFMGPEVSKWALEFFRGIFRCPSGLLRSRESVIQKAHALSFQQSPRSLAARRFAALSERLKSSFGGEISLKLKIFSKKLSKIGSKQALKLIADGHRPAGGKISWALLKAQSLSFLNSRLSTSEKAGRASKNSSKEFQCPFWKFRSHKLPYRHYPDPSIWCLNESSCSRLSKFVSYDN